MEEIKFEKVSYEQFKEESKKCGFVNEEEVKKAYENIELPERSTMGSAGYDFFTPYSFELSRYKNVITIPTGIRAKMPKNVALILMPRSGLGFKTGMTLANTLGLIDSKN